MFAAMITLLLTVVVADPSLYACTPPVGGLPSYTVAERVAAAEIVLEGTVTAVEGDPFPQTATITVHQYIKGSGPETVTMSNFGPSGICLSEVSVGDHRLFYASGDPADDLRAFYLSQFDAVAPADPATLNEAITAAGQEPFIPVQPGQNTDIPTPAVATPPAEPASINARSLAVAAVLGVSCFGLLLLGVLAALLWRKRSQG